MFKKCTSCKENKKLNEFSKNRSNKDELQYQCKKCIIKYAKTPEARQKQKKHRETLEFKEKLKEYRQKEEYKIQRKKYEQTEIRKIANKSYQNTKNFKIYRRIYRQIPKVKEAQRKCQHNPKTKKIKKEWEIKDRKNNPGKYTARLAKRRAAKLKRTPKWLTKEHHKEIKNFYYLCHELQWLSEEPLHVDHIIPLQGKDVSGLHVPWNLQILPASKNISKSNKLIIY